jgi:hypothetical protein
VVQPIVVHSQLAAVRWWVPAVGTAGTARPSWKSWAQLGFVTLDEERKVSGCVLLALLTIETNALRLERNYVRGAYAPWSG